MTIPAASAVETREPEASRLCPYLTEFSPQPTVALEGTAHIVSYLNPAFTRLIGVPSEALLGRPFGEAVREGKESGCRALLDRVYRTGIPEILREQEQTENRSTPVYWSYSVWAIFGKDERPNGVIVQITDATEVALSRRQAVAMNEALVVSSVRQHELIDEIRRGELARRELEERISQAQKLESLGVLAGGIAHDLNNILTPVLGYSDLAGEMLPPGSPAGPLLEQIASHARRAADLVMQILAYAGKGRFVVGPLDLSALVREAAGSLALGISDRVELRFQFASELPPIEADATQLRQVLANLASNAYESITERGTITIRTFSTTIDPGTLWSTHRKQHLPGGAYVGLEVTDTGHGMAADVMAKIFDPFFTTKFTGRGLGLAVVQGIAHGHRGLLEAQSEPGRGSQFRLLLPASTQRLEVRVPSVAAVATARSSGTILVIDDEAGILALATRILERDGFAVLAYTEGGKGLERFRERPDAADVALLDLTMPGMDGLEIAKALHGQRPGLPIILMSGYSVHEATQQSEGFGIAAFVQKPFSPASLLNAVRNAQRR